VKAVVLIAVLLTGAPVWAQRDDSLASLLRLKPGNYWIYSGKAESVDPTKEGEPPSVSKFHVRWKVEILEEALRGDLRAYLVHGWFLDLAWFETGRERGGYLWITYQNRFYVLQLNPDLLKAFRDPRASLLEKIKTEQPMIQLPLTDSQCAQPLEEGQELKRDDLFYCWHFEEKTKVRLQAAGLATHSAAVWKLWYRTMPDHQILGFVPHVGFVSYDFAHHGTPSEAHVKLVEAHLR
jgi:hypothetical protein